MQDLKEADKDFYFNRRNRKGMVVGEEREGVAGQDGELFSQ